MSDPVRPHRRQPTRLPRPWDSPGKNTGMGCHFLLQCMRVKRESEVAQSCPTLHDPMDCSLPGSSVHGIFQARVLEWVAIAFSGGNGRTYLSDDLEMPTTQVTLSNKDLIQTQRKNQMLYRQTKARRIPHHKTSSSTNAKGTSLHRKHKKEAYKNKPKTIK